MLSHIENKTNEFHVNSMKQIQDSFLFKCLAAFIILFSSSLPITSMFIIKVKIFDLLIQQKLILELIIVIISSIFGVLYHLKFAKAIFFSKAENGIIKIDTNLLGLIFIVVIHIITLIYMNVITEIMGYISSTITS
jgi:NADH:ubiquinone oxidoreductase subunit 2 (subunit N)